jgi:hypothetical protein
MSRGLWGTAFCQSLACDQIIYPQLLHGGTVQAQPGAAELAVCNRFGRGRCVLTCQILCAYLRHPTTVQVGRHPAMELPQPTQVNARQALKVH